MTWLGFIFVFLGLVGARLASHATPAVAVHGSELFAPAFDPKTPATATYTVLRAHADNHGNRVLSLQAPDRSQPTLVIPPTVLLTAPTPGSTIQVTAKRIGTGLLTLEHREDLKVLTPDYTDNSLPRQQLGAYVHVERTTDKGSLVAVLYDDQDQFIARSVVLADCANDLRAGYTTLYGYFTADHTFIVEDIL